MLLEKNFKVGQFLLLEGQIYLGIELSLDTLSLHFKNF